jgi:hypothetical protein
MQNISVSGTVCHHPGRRRTDNSPVERPVTVTEGFRKILGSRPADTQRRQGTSGAERSGTVCQFDGSHPRFTTEFPRSSHVIASVANCPGISDVEDATFEFVRNQALDKLNLRAIAAWAWSVFRAGWRETCIATTGFAGSMRGALVTSNWMPLGPQVVCQTSRDLRKAAAL